MLATLVVATTGCSATIPVNYAPQNFVRFEGTADIGAFSYAPTRIPEAEGRPVAPNQLQNTAVGQVFIGVGVADLVQRATALELEKTGVKLSDQSPVRLSGEVLEFKVDDLGYSVDWTYSVRYVIDRKADGTVLLSEPYSADKKKTGKFGQAADYSPSINEMILSAYDKFIRDPRVQAIIGGK